MRTRKAAAVGDLFAPPEPASNDLAPVPAPAEVDPAAGRERGIEGGEAALDHADAIATAGDEAWSERAYAFICAWVASQPLSARFAVEDVRVAWEAAENPVPPNNNAWGPLGRRLMRDRIVMRAGYRPATIKTSNGRAVAVYRRREASE